MGRVPAILCLSIAILLQLNAKDRTFRLDPLYTSHMVLQRGRPIVVRGWAPSGTKVTVTLAGSKAQATADIKGRWQATLPKLDAGGPYTVAVTGPREIVLEDVLIGDIWVCGGQSNMEVAVNPGEVENGAHEKAKANFPKIRMLRIEKEAHWQEQDTVIASSGWKPCTPKMAGRFSAVGYYFGSKLHRELNVPIGLIQSCWGGTPAQGWVSAEMLKTRPMYADYLSKKDQFEKEWGWYFKKHGWKEHDEQLKRIDDVLKDKTLGANLGAVDLDDSSWKDVKIPGAWFKNDFKVIPNYRGLAHFRKTVELSKSWAGKPLKLELGPVFDMDACYFNGVRIGGKGEPRLRRMDHKPRVYSIPGDLVKSKSVILCTVNNLHGRGGIQGVGAKDGPKTVRLSITASPNESVDLSGTWKCKMGQKLVPKFWMTAIACYLYNGMIAPILGFPMKGVIWYQGESNARKAKEYQTLFPDLIKEWRRGWGQGDFPFYFVQLTSYMGRANVPTESNWAELREAQTMALALPNTGMAVTIDIGDAKLIHPLNKKDIGLRLAQNALVKTYGKDLVPCGPLFKEMKVGGDKVVLTFDHVGSGLVAKGGKLVGFAIAGADRKFVWGDAVINGMTVVVSSPKVAKPVAIRYAWANNPTCNLFNKEGFPASPFRTDSWPRPGKKKR